MKIHSHTTSFIIILHLQFAAFEGKFNALIFDRFKKTLIQVPNEIPKNMNLRNLKWASACPASNDNKSDEDFNEKKSFSKNALFVHAQNIYNGENVKNLRVEICDEPFKLSIAMFEKIPLYYEFGYDIYFNHSDSENFQLSNKGIYKSLENTLHLPNLFKQLILLPFKVSASHIKAKASQGEQIIMQDKEKGFTWIPLFKMKNVQGYPFRIKYEIRQNNRGPSVHCQNYDLGKEMFKNIDVDSLYTEDVQKKTLEGVSTEVGLESTRFEKWLLIPADQFQFGSIEPPTCSNMATIPIWSGKVKRSLKNLDEYLYALSRESGHPLSIVAGFHKYLRLPSTLWGKKTIVLQNNGVKIRVSNIIYKLVTLKILKKDCNNEDRYCLYGVLIVIHNDPTFKTSKRICPDESKKLGWEDIVKSKYIYVCSIKPYIMVQLGMKYNINLVVNELSLKDFPLTQFDKRNKANMKEMISDKLKQESEREDELKFENEVIKRPPLDDYIVTN